MYPPVYLRGAYVGLPICLYICPSVFCLAVLAAWHVILSVCIPICVYICLRKYLSVCPAACLSICKCVCMYVYLSVYLFVWMSFCDLHLSVCLPV